MVGGQTGRFLSVKVKWRLSRRWTGKEAMRWTFVTTCIGARSYVGAI